MPLRDTESTFAPTAVFCLRINCEIIFWFSQLTPLLQLVLKFLFCYQVVCCFFPSSLFCSLTSRSTFTVHPLHSIAVCVCAVRVFVRSPICHMQGGTWKSCSLPLSADNPISLETCRQVVTELHNSLRKTIMLYTTVSECVFLCVCTYKKIRIKWDRIS